MSTRRLLCSNVVDVCSCDSKTAIFFGGTTADAFASWRDGGEVCGIGGVAEVEGSGRGDGVAEALG